MPAYNYDTKEKMQSSFGGRRRGAPNPGIGNLVGNPIAFATVSIAILGWLICLVSSVFCQVRPSPDGFGKFFWWVVVYELLVIVFVSWTIIQDVKNQYALATIGYVTVGVALTQLSVNTFITSTQPERIANTVGFIILSIVGFGWIFYFGSAIQTHEMPLPKDARYSRAQGSRPMSHNHFDRPRTTASGNNPQGLYPSAQVNGLETSSPVSGYPGGPIGAQGNPSQTRFQGASIPHTPTTARAANPLLDGPDVDAPTEYPYSAKAIYSYEANPDDANEISFTKHEILAVSDVSGRWWQARKENGEKGIAPSNYLILL